jgi:transcription elongation GreA/GreB family factor
MPAESAPDEDRISVLLPVALACLGRRRGDTITWECPRGNREMRIAAVEKSGELAI